MILDSLRREYSKKGEDRRRQETQAKKLVRATERPHGMSEGNGVVDIGSKSEQLP